MDRWRWRHTRQICFCVPMLVATGIPAPAAEPPVLLQPRFVPDRDVHLVFEQDIEQTLSGGKLENKPVKSRISQTFGLRRRVERAGGDGMRLRLTFERIAQRVESAAWPGLAYDSDGPADKNAPMLAAIYRPMLGQSLSMDVNADGTIRSCTGMEAIVARVRESAGDNLMFERVRGMLSDDMARCMWGDSLVVLFPHRAVSVGDTWTCSLPQPTSLAGPLVLDYEVRLERLATVDGRAQAELSFRGTIRPAVGAVGPAECTVCYALESGELNGTALIDVERGECTQQKDTGKVTLRMTVPDAGGDAPTTFEVVQELRSTFTARPAEPRIDATVKGAQP